MHWVKPSLKSFMFSCSPNCVTVSKALYIQVEAVSKIQIRYIYKNCSFEGRSIYIWTRNYNIFVKYTCCCLVYFLLFDDEWLKIEPEDRYWNSYIERPKIVKFGGVGWRYVELRDGVRISSNFQMLSAKTVEFCLVCYDAHMMTSV